MFKKNRDRCQWTSGAKENTSTNYSDQNKKSTKTDNPMSRSTMMPILAWRLLSETQTHWLPERAHESNERQLTTCFEDDEVGHWAAHGPLVLRSESVGQMEDPQWKRGNSQEPSRLNAWNHCNENDCSIFWVVVAIKCFKNSCVWWETAHGSD